MYSMTPVQTACELLVVLHAWVYGRMMRSYMAEVLEFACVTRPDGQGTTITTNGNLEGGEPKPGDTIQCLREERCVWCSGLARVTAGRSTLTAWQVRAVGTAAS